MEFRLIPEEHPDTLRLSSGLEEQAFVPTQSRSDLVALTTEVLDEIVLHLDAVCDLLALGLTCQRLRDLVHPRHTEYFFVRCRPSAVYVWHHLAAHPLLARNVRQLHIFDDNSIRKQQIIPSCTMGHTPENQTDICGLDMHNGRRDLILCALSHMTTLAKFSWDCDGSFICFDDIMPVLLVHSSLREVQIADNLLFRSIPVGGIMSPSDTFKVSQHLTCINSMTFRNGPFPCHSLPVPLSLSRIQQLISCCFNLTTLRIEIDYRWPSDFLLNKFVLRGRWPRLRTLSLRNLRFYLATEFNAVASFLAAHNLIETLDFEMDEVRVKLLAGTLPRLRHLACNSAVAAVILRCPMPGGQTRPVEMLRVVRTMRGQDGALMEGLRLCPGLKRLELVGYVDINDIKRLAEAAPSVTWLDVGRGLTKSGATAVSSVNVWAPVLSALPQLTAFHGVRFFYEPDGDATSLSGRSKIKNNDEVASMLLRTCPKLKRVDCWDDLDRVVFLSEEGEKFKWGVRHAQRYDDHLGFSETHYS